MVFGYRYIVVEEDGCVQTARETPIDGVTIDTEGMTVPEMPTDGIHDLYYNETDLLHWVKVADLTEDLTEADKQEAALAYIMAMTEGE